MANRLLAVLGKNRWQPRAQTGLDGVPYLPKVCQAICLAAVDGSRIGKTPPSSPGTARKHGAGFGSLVADRDNVDNVIKRLIEEFAQVFRPVMANVDMSFCHDLNRQRADRRWFRTGAKYLDLYRRSDPSAALRPSGSAQNFRYRE